MDISRRTALTVPLAGGLLTTPAAASPAAATPFGGSLVRRGRPQIVDGVASGDVTTRTATVWARSDRPARLVATVRGRGRSRRRVLGPWAAPESDHTAALDLRGLAPGRAHEVDLAFVDADGHVGERQTVHLRTAPVHAAPQRFVWGGDVAGQGWGINPDLGGYQAHRAMLATDPDFFLHSGDTIYADGPIQERVVEPDGQVWRNLVTEEVAVVAQDLREFRGRHRYNRMDEHLRAMSARVPIVAQWDDHETTNNWYPGEVLEDPRYDRERRVDVLAERARQAWWEHHPVSRGHARHGWHLDRGEPAPRRIYRTVSRGPHLDVFCLDMRTAKGENTAGTEATRTPILGEEQARWLVRELCRSRATWKVIAADLPLGLVVPDGDLAQESIANADNGAPLGRELEIAWVLHALRRARVRNVVWLTADVHYCAAHHYDPARASFTDFDPFWEFVAGPLNAGTFGPNPLDATFGPRVDFAATAARPGESPRTGRQYFGQVDIDADARLTVGLHDLHGHRLYRRTLEPRRR